MLEEVALFPMLSLSLRFAYLDLVQCFSFVIAKNPAIVKQAKADEIAKAVLKVEDVSKV